GLVVVLPFGVIIEHPARMLGATGLVHEATDLVVLALPEPAHPAVVAILVPELRVDVSAAIERRHEFVTMLRRAGRKLFRARQVEANAFERVRQCHGRTSHILQSIEGVLGYFAASAVSDIDVDQTCVATPNLICIMAPKHGSAMV